MERASTKSFSRTQKSFNISTSLRIADPDLPYYVNVDASGYAIGGWLSQDDGNGHRPVAYFSRKMTAAERNYPVHEQELLALLDAIKVWRPYLEGKKFRAYTDHRSLVWLQTQSTLSR